MNRYERHLRKAMDHASRVLDCLRYRRAYCHIDELLSNPIIFPPQDGYSVIDRVLWATGEKGAGCQWVVTADPVHTNCNFALLGVKEVPSMRYQHISKVWRDANEQI